MLSGGGRKAAGEGTTIPILIVKRTAHCSVKTLSAHSHRRILPVAALEDKPHLSAFELLLEGLHGGEDDSAHKLDGMFQERSYMSVLSQLCTSATFFRRAYSSVSGGCL